MRKIQTYFAFTVACTILSIFVYAERGVLYRVSLQQQINLSTNIIEGKVIDQVCFWNAKKSLIYTVNTVEVYKSFKGNTGEQVDIITLGGTVGDHSIKVCPELSLSNGDVGIFILKESNVDISQTVSIGNKRFDVISESQGFYKYNLRENIVTNALSTYRQITENFYERIKSISKNEYIEYKKYDVDQLLLPNKPSNGRTASINSISPVTASAGTKTVLTITGSGFGNSQGTVGFKDSDSGGQTFVDALNSEIVSWKDDEIKVNIPSHAGTGTVRVTDASSGTLESAEELTITFAQLNGIIENEAFETTLIDVSGDGGYTWHMFTEFDANSQAKKSFLRAFNTWICYSKVNWVLGTTTSTDKTEVDGENVIRFDNGDELPMGVLGRCVSHEFKCDNNVAIIEMDMIIDDAVNWNFGPDTPGEDEFDFESMVVHELGHGHQLAHVIDPDDIMYYGERGGDIKRELSENDKLGADYVLSRSMSNGICSFDPITEGVCQVVTGIDEQLTFENLIIYPNPAVSNLNIENDEFFGDLEISIFDITGKKISSRFPRVDAKKHAIDVSNLSQGVYFLGIKEEKLSYRKKFIVK